MRNKRVYQIGVALAAVSVIVLAAVLLAVAPARADVESSGSSESGFNGQSISAGDYIWFSSVVQLVGSKLTAPLHIHFDNQTLTFETKSGTSWSIKLADSNTLYDSGVTTATTTWDSSAYNWSTVVPMSYTGDVFLSGWSYKVPAGGIPAGTTVTWAGQFHSSENCMDFNWKWAAAVYTNMPHPYSADNNAQIGVKPVDDNQLSSYQNSDHAGTPENYTAYLTAGARGGGGSNFTGSYSGNVGINKCS
jgi:hypothetical protein